MKLTTDWHIHSRNSCDSACMRVADLVRQAQAEGIRDYGLTDHVHTPYNLPDLARSREEFLDAALSARFATYTPPEDDVVQHILADPDNLNRAHKLVLANKLQGTYWDDAFKMLGVLPGGEPAVPMREKYKIPDALGMSEKDLPLTTCYFRIECYGVAPKGIADRIGLPGLVVETFEPDEEGGISALVDYRVSDRAVGAIHEAVEEVLAYVRPKRDAIRRLIEADNVCVRVRVVAHENEKYQVAKWLPHEVLKELALYKASFDLDVFENGIPKYLREDRWKGPYSDGTNRS